MGFKTLQQQREYLTAWRRKRGIKPGTPRPEKQTSTNEQYRERIRQRQREYKQRRKANPEQHGLDTAYARERYHSHITQEAYRAALRASNQAWRARRKIEMAQPCETVNQWLKTHKVKKCPPRDATASDPNEAKVYGWGQRKSKNVYAHKYYAEHKGKTVKKKRKKHAVKVVKVFKPESEERRFKRLNTQLLKFTPDWLADLIEERDGTAEMAHSPGE